MMMPTNSTYRRRSRHALVECARLDERDGRRERLVRALHEPLAVLVHVTHEERLVQVGVVAAVVHGHVHVDDVAVLQGAQVGDAVADHLRRRVMEKK